MPKHRPGVDCEPPGPSSIPDWHCPRCGMVYELAEIEWDPQWQPPLPYDEEDE